MRLAALDGPPAAVADLLAALPDTVEVLGRSSCRRARSLPGADERTEGAERCLARVPRAEGRTLARELHAAQAVRSARKEREPVRVLLDPARPAVDTPPGACHCSTNRLNTRRTTWPNENPADRHRAVAAVFTERVRGTADWDVPAPVAGLDRARRRGPPDVVVPGLPVGVRGDAAGRARRWPTTPSPPGSPARGRAGAARRPGERRAARSRTPTSAR